MNSSNSSKYLTLCQFHTATELEMILFRLLECYVNPFISVLGLGANTMSIAILRKNGLSKPSNILLLGLVIADSMTILETINYADILALLGPDMEYPLLCGWQYGNGVNYFLLVSYIIFSFFGTWGMYVDTAIPVVITIERFLAVYMPMTFKQIVTRKSAIVSVVVCFVIWLPWNIFTMAIQDVYIQKSKVMFFASWNHHVYDQTAFSIFNYYVCDIMSSWFPMLFVILGCVLIWARVKVSLSQRKLMTSVERHSKASNRTTRTLVTTCFIFSVTHAITSFTNYFIVDSTPTQFYLRHSFMNLIYLLNASSNFFVYVTTNRKLYLIFKKLIHFSV